MDFKLLETMKLSRGAVTVSSEPRGVVARGSSEEGQRPGVAARRLI